MKILSISARHCLYALLIATAPALYAQDAAHGQQVFEHYCTPCHGAGPGDDGAPMLPGTHAIYLKYRGERPPLLQDRSDLSYDFIRTVVRGGLASMPPFRKTELTDTELADIKAYFDKQ